MGKTFSKRPTTIEEQITILQSRGMHTPDTEHAKRFLSYCSYYRFCGYALHFEELTSGGERTHRYKPNTTFPAVEEIYHFDAALRRIIFHYTSLIEIDFRGTIGNESAWHYNNAHWFLEGKYFQDKSRYSKFIDLCNEEVDRSREIFITSYRKNYTAPALPPIWMLTELMPFAVWSKLYQNLSDNGLRKIIAHKQGIPEKYLVSWMQSLTVLRNACAHHARIWNRNFSLAPRLSPHISKKITRGNEKKIYVMFLIIHDMLKKISRENDFHKDIEELLKLHPAINPKYLGICCPIDEMFM